MTNTGTSDRGTGGDASPDRRSVRLDAFITADELTTLIHRARFEDLGPMALDVTSRLFVPDDRTAEAKMVARQPGTLAGLVMLDAIARAYDANVETTLMAADGETVAAGQTIARFAGPLRSMLAMERVALNFASHLAGIATLTADYVRKVAGTRARICDTRKTLPGLRAMQKYAVACGGGLPHRMGLYDAMLVKDNHLAGVEMDRLTDALRDAIDRGRRLHPDLKFVEVEVDNLEQLERVLPCGADVVLLDNMPPDALAEAVAMRDREAPDVQLEASGGVSLDTVAAIAQTGVERISVGSLTHSAPALDLGVDL